MTVRNVKKSLVGMQDITQGVGDQVQTRNGVNYNIAKVDVPYAVDTEVKMQDLDVAKYTRARVYNSTTDYIDYIYDPAAVAGVSSNTGAGFWVKPIVSHTHTAADVAYQGTNVATYLANQNFDTVAEMTAAIGMTVGDTIRCKERGNGLFDVILGTGTANGLNIIAHDTENTSFVLRVSAPLDVSQYGAKGDGATNDSASFQAAVDSGIETVYARGQFGIASTIIVPVGVHIIFDGRNSEIIPLSGGAFIDNRVFIFNSTDGANPTVAFPNMQSGGMRNVRFNNFNLIANIKGILAFGSYVFEEIRGRNMYGLIERPGGGVYSDNFAVRRVYSEPVLGTDYQIELNGLGDSPVVEECHFPWNALNPGDGSVNGIKIANSYGSVIRDCVGGNVYLTDCVATIENGHYEKSQMLIENSDVKLVHPILYADGKEPIVLSSSGSQNYTLTMSDVEFAYLQGNIEWTGADLKLATRYNVNISNCNKKWTVDGSLDKSVLTGIKIYNSSGTEMTEFSDFSYLLSRNGTIFPSQFLQKITEIVNVSQSFAGISTVSDGFDTWSAANGTYYYKAQILLDRVRLVGRNQVGAESSLALTSGGNAARIELDLGSRPLTGTLRLYRGTSTGSYDKYVDIPLINASRVYDDGTNVCGFPWISRGASGVDAINSIGESAMKIFGSTAEFYGAAPPTVGAWGQSDKIYRSAPAAGGTIGWVCTTAGSPGTWKTFGTISA